MVFRLSELGRQEVIGLEWENCWLDKTRVYHLELITRPSPVCFPTARQAGEPVEESAYTPREIVAA